VHKLHNDLLGAPPRGGFSLVNRDAPLMLVNDAAFQKFSEMSNIGLWLDREDKLQWDYRIDAGYRGARSVRNDRVGGRVGGAALKDAFIQKDGYLTNKRGKECIAGFHGLGNLRSDALIQKDGYMTNKRGKEVSAGFHELGTLGGAVHARISAATALGEHHTHICISALCRRGASVSW